MQGETMFSLEEALGAQEIVKRVLLMEDGELSAREKRALGRILSEALFTLEVVPSEECGGGCGRQAMTGNTIPRRPCIVST